VYNYLLYRVQEIAMTALSLSAGRLRRAWPRPGGDAARNPGSAGRHAGTFNNNAITMAADMTRLPGAMDDSLAVRADALCPQI
jgi:hypothetical protein